MKTIHNTPGKLEVFSSNKLSNLQLLMVKGGGNNPPGPQSPNNPNPGPTQNPNDPNGN